MTPFSRECVEFMHKTIHDIYQSPLFDHPSIIHGFSIKKFGDMRNREKRRDFVTAIGGDEKSLVWQEQVHGDAIHIVTEKDHGKIIQGVDGLVYKKNLSDSPISLSVHTADCIPLLFFDPVSRVIAAAHAGWRGTVLHIGKKVLQNMHSLGSTITDIRVAIGPRVCGSCYTIIGDREQKFRDEFPTHQDIITVSQEIHTVDIGLANFYDFIDIGIPKISIDVDPSLCTYEKTDDFYSYRRSGKPLQGEILGVIGLI